MSVCPPLGWSQEGTQRPADASGTFLPPEGLAESPPSSRALRVDMRLEGRHLEGRHPEGRHPEGVHSQRVGARNLQAVAHSQQEAEHTQPEVAHSLQAVARSQQAVARTPELQERVGSLVLSGSQLVEPWALQVAFRLAEACRLAVGSLQEAGRSREDRAEGRRPQVEGRRLPVAGRVAGPFIYRKIKPRARRKAASKQAGRLLVIRRGLR